LQDTTSQEGYSQIWVVIPLIGAGLYWIWQGDWKLALLAAVVAAVSERYRISQAFGWE